MKNKLYAAVLMLLFSANCAGPKQVSRREKEWSTGEWDTAISRRGRVRRTPVSAKKSIKHLVKSQMKPQKCGDNLLFYK